jgi:NAD(P)-dependent dehydrogenase (short-subunit alcohol dehydrogenase family)
VSRALVFGGTGALGSAIVAELTADGWEVAGASRSDAATGVLLDGDWAGRVAADGAVEAVVWAQGINLKGSAPDVPASDMLRAFEANVVFITETLSALVAADALARPARGVVVSSVWQIAARSERLAYVTSKSALGGLVPALAADLADRAFAVNGVLPGVIDTPMTRAALTPEQIERVEAESLGGRLASPGDVGRAVAWLAHPRAAGINAQWIAVDNGWASVRRV